MATTTTATENTSSQYPDSTERGGSESRIESSGRKGQSQGGNQRQAAVNVTATAMRGMGQLFDMQAATARVLMRAQLRTACAFGMPDYSGMLQTNDDRATRLFSTATENLMQVVDQGDSPLAEMSSQMIRLIEQQAIAVTERMKDSLQEMKSQTAQSMEELKQLTRQQADEVSRASEMLMNATKESLHEGGQQLDKRAKGHEQDVKFQAYQMQPEYRERRQQLDGSIQKGQDRQEQAVRETQGTQAKIDSSRSMAKQQGVSQKGDSPQHR